MVRELDGNALSLDGFRLVLFYLHLRTKEKARMATVKKLPNMALTIALMMTGRKVRARIFQPGPKQN